LLDAVEQNVACFSDALKVTRSHVWFLQMSGIDIPAAILIGVLVLVIGGGYLLLDIYWWQPMLKRRARRHVERLRREEEAGLPPSSKDYHFAIEFDTKGLHVRDLRRHNRVVAEAPWSSVRVAIAFKLDLFTVDCICIAFQLDEGTELQINEEMAGWNRLNDALPGLLPGSAPLVDWYVAVAFPAFEANLTRIYEREPSS
jgi:hypothetical protein